MTPNDHPTEDFLEEFIFHRLSDGDTENLQDHLRQCRACQDALDLVLDFVEVIKYAVRAREAQYPIR